MPAPTGNKLEHIEYLYAALASKYGIAVRTSSVKLLRGRLYLTRAASGDPDLNRLQLRPSPHDPDHLLWIVKGPETNAP